MAYRNDRLAEIEKRLEELGRENQELRQRLETRMKSHATCPACQSQEIIHLGRILDRNSGGAGTMALVLASIWTGRTEGDVEAFICRQCGMMEWYVEEPQSIQLREKGKFPVRIHKLATD